MHGLWLLPNSWDRWAAVFEEAGYTVNADWRSFNLARTRAPSLLAEHREELVQLTR